MNHHIPPLFIERLAGLMLFKVSPAVRQLNVAWCKAEGGTATWNPWNTEYEMIGATDYNSQGVKNYPSPIAGIAATALTLSLEPYRTLWVDLQHGGYTAKQLVIRNAHCFDTWGTGAGNILREL